MILHRPPDPPARIPLRKLMRNEQTAYWVQVVIAYLIIPGGFIAAVLAAHDLYEGFGIACGCSGLPIVLTLFVVGLRFIVMFSPNVTARMLREQLGPYGPVKEMIACLDTELADLSKAWIGGRMTANQYGSWPNCGIMTDRWLIRMKHREMCFVPLNDLLWVHKRISVKVGRMWSDQFTYHLCVVTEGGLDQTISMQTEALLDAIMERLIRRRPELLCGYRGEIQDLFAKGKPALKEAIARRHDQWDTLSEDAREDWLEDALDDAIECVQRVEVA